MDTVRGEETTDAGAATRESSGARNSNKIGHSNRKHGVGRKGGKTLDLPRDTKAMASEADEHRGGQSKVSFWTDGSRLESGKTGAEVAWRHQPTWKTRRVHMKTNKEVFNAELYAVAEALEVASKDRQTTRGRAPQEAALP